MLAASMLVPIAPAAQAAGANERELYLYYTHTRETARIVFWRNGQFVQSGIRELNQFLRDWRRNEPANMDPNLFNLLWSIYREAGASQPINIVSAYRSPQTNEMLRANSSGVAENSQHTHGKAMDFFIPGVELGRLREIAMRHQVGGVGFYPTSGSPFVHVDTGNVRAWPRMTRTQLARIFPDGQTLHLPTDGTPLSANGRQVAQAEWQRCQMIPCGRIDAGGGGGGGNLIDMIFGNNGAETVQVADTGPSTRPVETFDVAPVPMTRPGAVAIVAALDVPAEDADIAPPIPMDLSPAMALALARAATPAADGLSGEANAALLAMAEIEAPIPAPRIIMSNPPAATVLAAYAPAPGTDPIATLIDPATTSATSTNLPPLPDKAPVDLGDIRLAALTPDAGGLAAIQGLVDSTWSSIYGTDEDESVNTETQSRNLPVLSGSLLLDTRAGELVAPDLDHVTEIFLTATSVVEGQFGVLYEHDEADFDPATEMGAYGLSMGFTTGIVLGLVHDRFIDGATVVVPLQ